MNAAASAITNITPGEEGQSAAAVQITSPVLMNLGKGKTGTPIRLPSKARRAGPIRLAKKKFLPVASADHR